jgi:hypothetical protein
VNQYRASPNKGGNTRPIFIPPSEAELAARRAVTSVATTAGGVFEAEFKFSRPLRPRDSDMDAELTAGLLPALEKGRKVRGGRLDVLCVLVCWRRGGR